MIQGRTSLRQQGIGSPLSRFPSGEKPGRAGSPTPRTLAASQLRWHPSMPRLPPQEGFQNAPLKSPLRDPPAGHAGIEPKKYLPDQRLVRYNRSCPEQEFRWPVLK